MGSKLVLALLKKNKKVIVLKRSFSNTRRLTAKIKEIKFYNVDEIKLSLPFEQNKIDCIIHTATCYGRKNESKSNILDANLNFPLKILDLAHFFNVNTFINTDTMLYDYTNDYTLSKKQFLEWGKLASNKINFINMRIEHIYGPDDDESKFVTWLIREFIRKKTKINLTKGEQNRDFIYIDDVVSAYMAVLKNIKKFHEFVSFDIGSGKLINIKSFVLLVRRILENKFNFKSDTILDFGAIPYRKNEFYEIKEDLKWIYSTGWRTKIDLNLGLKKTIDFEIRRKL